MPLISAILNNSEKCVNAKYPLSFERLGQSTGFVLYMVTLDDPNVDGKYMHIASIGDRAYIQIGDVNI